MDAPPSEGFTPILHAPVVGGVSEPEEELDWGEEFSQEIEKDDQRGRAREAAEERQEAREDGEVTDEAERAGGRARAEEQRDLRVSLERMPGGTPRTSWVSENTKQALTRGIVGPQRTECRYCDFTSLSIKRLQVHVQQHFLRQYCPCGLLSTPSNTSTGPSPSSRNKEGIVALSSRRAT